MFDVGYRIYDLQNKLIRESTGSGGESEHIDDFLRCVREGGVPAADIETGTAARLLCHLGNIAHRVGAVLTIDPQNGHMLESAAARLSGDANMPPAGGRRCECGRTARRDETGGRGRSSFCMNSE